MALIQGHGGVGRRRGRRPRSAPRAGRRSRLRVGHAAVRRLLSVPARARRHVPVPRPQGPDDLVPMADMRDGTPVYANSHIGGLAELMVTFEEWVVPVFTKATAADLGMVCSCVASRASAPRRRRRALVEPGSTVAVVGCGPLGLSARAGRADLRRVDDHRHRSRSRATRAWR